MAMNLSAIPAALTNSTGQTPHRASFARATVLAGVAWCGPDARAGIRGRVEVGGEANHRR